MIKFTNEIALITAVSDLRMFLDNVKGFTALFCRINSRSVAEKSPSGPIKIHKDLQLLRSPAFKLYLEFTSANNDLSMKATLSNDNYLRTINSFLLNLNKYTNENERVKSSLPDYGEGYSDHGY